MFDTYQQIFDARGGSYDAAMRRWPQARRAELATLVTLADLQPGWQVCDVPAGGGYLAEYVPADVGLTLVETSALFHKLSLAKGGRPCLLAAGNVLPFANRSLDAVLSLAGLHHNPDQPGFYAEAARVLQPGGTLCFADVAEGSPVAAFLDGFVGGHLAEGHCGTYLNDRTTDQLNRAGFDTISSEDRAVPWHFTTEGEMAAFCRGLFGITDVDDTDMIRVLDKRLGFRPVGDGIELTWSLRYLKALKSS